MAPAPLTIAEVAERTGLSRLEVNRPTQPVE
jgi:DNA-binding transcriptional regulator GbsR (MarR family)